MKFRSTIWCCLVLGAVCALAGPDSRVGAPQPGGPAVLPPGVVPRELEGVDVTEHLNQPVDLSLTFIDENGQTVALKDFFHQGRPVILDLIYYTCPNLCDLILNGQVAAMHEIPGTPGTDYDIVTVSIDPQETFKIAAQKAQPAIMEPIYTLEIVVPDQYAGDIMSDMTTRRGRVMGMDTEHGRSVVTAQVPLAEIQRYSNDLRSMTGGRGVYTMTLDRYDPVPSNVAQGIIAQHKAEVTAES